MRSIDTLCPTVGARPDGSVQKISADALMPKSSTSGTDTIGLEGGKGAGNGGLEADREGLKEHLDVDPEGDFSSQNHDDILVCAFVRVSVAVIISLFAGCGAKMGGTIGLGH